MIDSFIQVYCGAVLIADGSESGGIVEDLSVNGTRIIQEAQPLRADWITVFGRGNRKNTVSLLISVDQGSLTAALLATLQQNDNLPDQADLIINFTEAGVGSISARMQAAGWNPIDTIFIGRSTKTKFSVIGGQFLVGAGLGVPGIDGGSFDAPNFELSQGYPVDGGNFGDRQLESGYLIDGGNF